MTGQHANRFQSFYHRPVLPFFWLGPFHLVATPRQLHRQLAGQLTVCGLPENLLKSKIEYVASMLFQTLLKNCHWNGVNEVRCSSCRWQMKWQNNTSPWSLSPVVNPLSQCQFKSDRGRATWWVRWGGGGSNCNLPKCLHTATRLHLKSHYCWLMYSFIINIQHL